MNNRAADLPLVDLDSEKSSPELRRGLFETGFFLLRDHVIPRQLLDGVRDTALAFMDRPEAEKQEFRGGLRGWAPFRAESAAAGYGDGSFGAGDACQKFSMGPIVSAETRASAADYYNDPDGESYFAENLFPDATMRALWEEYYERMQGLCARLVDTVRAALGLPGGAWDAATTAPVSVLRFLAYPDLAGGIRMGAHYDDTLLTVLHQSVPENGFAGLQVQLPGEGQWRSVVPSDDVFVVNVGQTLTYLSGGRVVATKHRVVAPPPEKSQGSARTSLAHFHLPNWNARLWPAEAEGMDQSLGQHATEYHFDDLLEPDGSVLFYKTQRRAIERLLRAKRPE